ncbi:MAG TPA: 50S ribosomal protein L35 [Dehalococcoidia bacterium]|nr:50S ribosomal protein L35 [Dehalococcoidia bacterium]
MPKIKTHKGAKSRFHVTGRGKLMRTKCGKSHLRRKKTPRTKRLYDEMVPTSSADKKMVKRLLPYK